MSPHKPRSFLPFCDHTAVHSHYLEQNSRPLAIVILSLIFSVDLSQEIWWLGPIKHISYKAEKRQEEGREEEEKRSLIPLEGRDSQFSNGIYSTRF